ncbi:MAG: hypothetical protein JW827_07590, partial [Spirochaetes bacterium]|nr:hypothetical protein [Spirochaetota bacterium]
ISSLQAYYYDPEQIYTGYGIVADNTGPASIGVNPAGIGGTHASIFSVTLIDPGVLHNMNVLYKLNKNFGFGFSVVSMGEFHSYETGLGIGMKDMFNLGFNIAIHRELAGATNEQVNYGFSTGLQVSIKDYYANSPLGISTGIHLKNAVSQPDLNFYTNFTLFTLDYGVAAEVLVPDLRVYLGLNYNGYDSAVSASVNYGWKFINAGIGLNSRDELFYGIRLGKLTGNIALGITSNLENDTGFGALSYTKSFGKLLIPIRRQSTVTRKDLRTQRELIDQGLKYYRAKDYKKARSLFSKAYWIAPKSQYGKEANDYLQRVNRILKEIQ